MWTFPHHLHEKEVKGKLMVQKNIFFLSVHNYLIVLYMFCFSEGIERIINVKLGFSELFHFCTTVTTMALPWSYWAPQTNSITLFISSSSLTKTTSRQLYGKTANESINKINGSVWGHVPHQLISGITSPLLFLSGTGRVWRVCTVRIGRGRGGKSEGEGEKKLFSPLMKPPILHWSLGCYSLLSILQGQGFCLSACVHLCKV